MNIEKIKAEIINSIQHTNDKDLLDGISRLTRLTHSEEKLIEFSDRQNEQIDEALNQIENGEYLMEDEADKEVDSWLKD